MNQLKINKMKEVIFSIGTSTYNDSYDTTVVREEGKYLVAICINEKHYASKSKNESAKKDLMQWFDKAQNSELSPKELYVLILKLINDPKKFEKSKSGVEVYKEYLKIRSGNFLGKLFANDKQPQFPIKSYTLMIEWYKSIIENKQNEYAETTIDEFSDDIKLELEITLLDELIAEIDSKYLNPKPKEGIRKVALPMGGNRTHKVDLIPIKRFFTWLEKRKIELAKTNNSDTSELVDLSNTKAVEKLIYLKEIGVIDFLRTKQPFNLSVNSFASVISAITGENVSTIQSYLNGHLSGGADKRKDFYSSQSSVSKVQGKLLHIGFQLK
jgi:hypothetical protein